jgi:hypothetical protein
VVPLAGFAGKGDFGLIGEPGRVLMSDRVVYQNPNLDLWGKANAVINYYAKFRAIFPDTKEYRTEYIEIELLIDEIETQMEDFGEMLGGIEAKRDLWKKVNRVYALISTIDTRSGIIKSATEKEWVI